MKMKRKNKEEDEKKSVSFLDLRIYINRRIVDKT